MEKEEVLVCEEPLEIWIPRSVYELLRVLPIVKQLSGQLCQPHLLQPRSSCALMLFGGHSADRQGVRGNGSGHGL